MLYLDNGEFHWRDFITDKRMNSVSSDNNFLNLYDHSMHSMSSQNTTNSKEPDQIINRINNDGNDNNHNNNKNENSGSNEDDIVSKKNGNYFNLQIETPNYDVLFNKKYTYNTTTNTNITNTNNANNTNTNSNTMQYFDI